VLCEAWGGRWSAHPDGRATASGLHEAAWQTGRYLRRLYSESDRIDNSARASRMAAESARKAGDRRAEGRALQHLGWAYSEPARRRPGADLDEAETCMRKAVDLCGAAGDERDRACALNGLGKVLGQKGRRDEARAAWAESEALYERLGNPRAAEVRQRQDRPVGDGARTAC
jgi:hypothetical protein